MGSGKGSVNFWVASVKVGNVFLEIDKQISNEFAHKLFKALSYKLPIKVKMISKD
jgi:ribosomal protein L16/L10AE